MLSEQIYGSPMNRNLLGFGMRYGTDRGGVEMIGRGELWYTKEEDYISWELGVIFNSKVCPSDN